MAFGLGYLLVILVHSGLWHQVYGSGVTVRFGAFNLVGALCVIAAVQLVALVLVVVGSLSTETRWWRVERRP